MYDVAFVNYHRLLFCFEYSRIKNQKSLFPIQRPNLQMHEFWTIPFTGWRHFCFVIAGNGRSKSHQRGDENLIVWQWEFWGFFMDAYLQKTYINVLYWLNVAFFNIHVLRVLRVSWMYHFSFFMLMICLRVVVGFECSESFESWWVCAILWIIF